MDRPGEARAWTAACTLFALVSFAANSILCRVALRHSEIDAATFSAVRLASGAVTLALLAVATRRGASEGPALAGSWRSAALLFLYAIPFSLAYNGLTAGTGALILFGCVQATMLVGALRLGERPHPLQWLGLAAAVAGLVYLVLPGLAAPPPGSAALMALAGVSWGLYSLRGRGVPNPLEQTAGNFVRSAPLAIAVAWIAWSHHVVSSHGVWLALASGAIASGLGYVSWYAALPRLTATSAAVVQLAVPILAAATGAFVLGETITGRLAIAAAIILGGIAAALLRPRVARPAAGRV